MVLSFPFPFAIIGSAMTGNAIVDVADAFLKVLGNHVSLLMFVAAKASEYLEIAIGVASFATGIVRPRQIEEAGVIHGCSRPIHLVVTAAATGFGIGVQGVFWRHMARCTI